MPEIRTLTPAEVETLIDWAAGEGWNPGRHDAAAFRAADPDGFLGAFVDGEMVSGISAVAYGEDFGFIGLYICRPDRRGRGHGKAVWDAGMARLAGRTVGLDGVPAQLANYRSMGFAPAYRTFRFSGRPKAAQETLEGILPVEPAMLARIAAFDRAYFPGPRADFLRGWIGKPHVSLACMAGERMLGYGVTRACREGFKVGPLFATDGDAAKGLLAALAGACAGDIHIDVPEDNRAFSDFLTAAGMSRGFETTRMYRGPAPTMDLAGVFGVTTLELG